MKIETFIFFVCVVVFCLTFVYAQNEVAGNKQIAYNCELAEFHPDFPKEVKQKCRELKNENLRN